MLFLHLGAVVVGIGLLVGGGELLVRASVATATRLRVAPFVIGASVVAFGTSFPELVVAVRASIGNHAGIILGNVAGSNIANVLLAVGVAAACRPLAGARGLRLDALVMLFATAGFVGLALWVDVLTRLGGLALVVALAATTTLSIRRAGADVAQAAGEPATQSLAWSAVVIMVSLTMVAGGAEALVAGASGLARAFGVAEAVIGLSIVAIGTSLPEVTVTALAALRRQGGLALGGILGSNMFNLLGVTGAAALAHPLAMHGVLTPLDLTVLVGTTLFLAGFLTLGRSLHRSVGAGLVLLQVLYLGALYAGSY
ncbi:MAG: sodium:calcium antiporter [Alphaproteobacteria bacterium]|nr:sodium:calcium antiporter [Alphaproteobacteria bacterium]